MNEAANLVLAIFGAIMVWTTSIIGGIIWLNGKFRSLEKAIYIESDKLRREYEHRLYNQNTRTQRLEIKVFGFSGTNGGAVEPDDGATFP